MAERAPQPSEAWEETFEPITELARMVIEARRKRHASGERFLSDDEIDGLRESPDEPGR